MKLNLVLSTVMNEKFGQAQLEKYGWKAGAGLGKQEQGIKEAIKPSLKFDKCGVGHDPSEEFTFSWWDHVFNNAAKNIEVINSEEKVEVIKKGKDSVEISTKKSQVLPSLKSKLTYGSFVKTGTLAADGEMISCENSNESTSSNGDDQSTENTYEEIFKKCDGRTAHRAARHGLKMNGKLMRIMRQEQEVLCAKVSNTFHKRRASENEKPVKEAGTRHSVKKHKVKEGTSEHEKRSLVSAVNKNASSFINAAVGRFSDLASKNKKKKSKPT